MRATQLTNRLFYKCYFKTVFISGVVVFLCMALSSRATLIPLPTFCITDNDNGTTPTVVISGWDSMVTVPPGTLPTITSGIGQLDFQFFVNPVMFPIPGQTAVILKDQGTGNPSDIIILTVAQFIGKNSVDVFFADQAAANFNTLISTWSGTAASVFETGVQQDVSPYLYSSEETLAICVGCGIQVPDTASTLALMGLGLGGILLMYWQLTRRSAISR